MIEIWKDVKGYEGLYQVSDKGNVKSIDRLTLHNINGTEMIRKGKKLNMTKNSNGYLRVFLSKRNEVKTHYVHRLVGLHFLTNENPKNNQINHMDGNKENNTVSNLEWCTGQDNLSHGFKTGLLKHGERSNLSKLNERQVLKIVELRNEGLTAIELSKIFNVHTSTIHRIISGRSWRRLTKISH